MGGGGSSSSSSSSTSTTEQYDQRTALEGGGIAIGAQATATFNVVDPGAIELSGRMLDLVGEGGGRLIDATFSLAERSQELVEKNQELISAFVAESNKESSERLGGKALDLIVPLAAGYFLYKAVTK